MPRKIILSASKLSHIDSPYHHADLISQYEQSIASLIRDFNEKFTRANQATGIAFAQLQLAGVVNYNIAPYPTHWRDENRYFQTEIAVQDNNAVSFAGEMLELQFEFRRQQLNDNNDLNEENKYFLLECIEYFSEIHKFILEDYKRKFLRATQKKLRENVARMLRHYDKPDLAQKVERLNLNENEMQTCHEARKMHLKTSNLAAEIKSTLPLHQFLLPVVEELTVTSNLIIDEYYFNPIRFSEGDKFRASVRVAGMSTAVVANLLFLALIITALVLPPAAPALIPIGIAIYSLGFIGLAGLLPVFDDLCDLALCVIYKRAPKYLKSTWDKFWIVIFPCIMITTITSTMIVNLAPSAEQVHWTVATAFKALGDYILPSLGLSVNAYFSTSSLRGFWRRSKTAKVKIDVRNMNAVDLNDGLAIINRDRKLHERVELHNITHPTALPTTPGDVTEQLPEILSQNAPAKSGPLCFFYGSIQRQWHTIASKQEDITKSIYKTRWGNPFQKSAVYKAVEAAINDYKLSLAGESVDERIEKVQRIIDRCDEWNTLHTHGFSSLRKPIIDAALANARDELRTLRLIQAQQDVTGTTLDGQAPELALLAAGDNQQKPITLLVCRNSPAA